MSEAKIMKKIEKIEREINEIKNLILMKENIYEKKLISLKNSAKLLVPEKEIEKEIKKAKKSLLKV